jgi:uncharacterized protein YkwD
MELLQSAAVALPLEYSIYLEKVAIDQAKDMGSNNVKGSKGSTGLTLEDRIAKYGVRKGPVSELQVPGYEIRHSYCVRYAIVYV